MTERYENQTNSAGQRVAGMVAKAYEDRALIHRFSAGFQAAIPLPFRS
jgi:hypothetical protein